MATQTKYRMCGYLSLGIMFLFLLGGTLYLQAAGHRPQGL